jgi:hypothetical protein
MVIETLMLWKKDIIYICYNLFLGCVYGRSGWSNEHVEGHVGRGSCG